MCYCFTVWLVLVILDCSWSVSLLYCLACTRNIGLFMKCVIALLFGLYSNCLACTRNIGLFMCHCFTVWLVLVILDCSWSVSLLYCLACTRNIGLFMKCVIALLFGLYSSHWTVHEVCHCFTVWLVLVILDCSRSVLLLYCLACTRLIGLFMKCVIALLFGLYS